MTKNVLLCGVGDQGTALTSCLITLAAMEKGMEARGAETIGTAQRGGGVVSHVCIGEEIYFSLVPHDGADVPIGFEPAEAVRCPPYLRKGGCVVVSPAPVQLVTASLTRGGYTGLEVMKYLEHAADNLTIVDATSIRMTCGPPKVTNIALLGVAITSRLIGVSLGKMEAAIEKRAPERFKDINMKALGLGVSASPMIR